MKNVRDVPDILLIHPIESRRPAFRVRNRAATVFWPPIVRCRPNRRMGHVQRRDGHRPRYTNKRSSNKLCRVDSDLCQTAPATIAEFIAKWRQVARLDGELGDPSDTHVSYITQMLDELQAINGRYEAPQ